MCIRDSSKSEQYSSLPNIKKFVAFLKKIKKQRVKSQQQFKKFQKQIKDEFSEEHLIEFMILVEIFFGENIDLEWIYDLNSNRSKSTGLYMEHNSTMRDVLTKPKGAYNQSLYEIVLSKAADLRLEGIKDPNTKGLNIDKDMMSELNAIIESVNAVTSYENTTCSSTPGSPTPLCWNGVTQYY
eukprot:TRINITY_DN1300_c0_g1_i12.p1 TRINITY_DN1300_c0_g1~~TRINITY_DN1300_c0_g1_i12.p1  ORF type:complete len:199 (-),score=96.99 TRINITY_DN1300_c0_g1_i12:110-658(-)